MTTKRTPIDRGHRLQITPAAVRRWRQIRPRGLGPSCIDDDELGELIGLPAMLYQTPETLAALHRLLEDALISEMKGGG